MLETVFKHYDELNPVQQREMLVLLLEKDKAEKAKQDRPKPPTEQQPPVNVEQLGLITGAIPVALLNRDRVIAAIVTDEDHHIKSWGGQVNPRFFKRFGYTPAEAIIRAYLGHRGDGKISFIGKPSTGAVDLFYHHENRPDAYNEGISEPTGEINSDVSTFQISESRLKRLKPDILCRPEVWRPYYFRLHNARFQRMK